MRLFLRLDAVYIVSCSLFLTFIILQCLCGFTMCMNSAMHYFWYIVVLFAQLYNTSTMLFYSALMSDCCTPFLFSYHLLLPRPVLTSHHIYSSLSSTFCTVTSESTVMAASLRMTPSSTSTSNSAHPNIKMTGSRTSTNLNSTSALDSKKKVNFHSKILLSTAL
jgi:hypothetical protein